MDELGRVFGGLCSEPMVFDQCDWLGKRRVTGAWVRADSRALSKRWRLAWRARNGDSIQRCCFLLAPKNTGVIVVGASIGRIVFIVLQAMVCCQVGADVMMPT